MAFLKNLHLPLTTWEGNKD